MRKEYWAAAWVKIIFSINALGILSVDIFGLMSKHIQAERGLIFLGVFILLFGAFFLAAAFVVYRWPLIIIDGDVLLYQRFFKTNRIDCLSGYQIQRAGQQIWLISKTGKKIVLGSTIIGKKNVDELYGYILRYCEVLPEIKS